MGNKHDKPTPPADSNDLLDELESIKGLLDDSIADDEQHEGIDIPILDDIVTTPESLNVDTSLLDLEDIFDETEPESEPESELESEQEQESEQKPGPQAESSADTDSSLTGMALDDLELSEFGLDGMDLADLGTDIEMPDFKLQAEIIEPQFQDEATAEPSSATDGAATLDDNDGIEGTDASLEDDLAQLDDDPDLWLEDDPIADSADNQYKNKDQPMDDQEQQDELLAEPATSTEPTVDLDFLIQEIVDEVIPQIEDQLRRRLSACSSTVIKQLAEKSLKK